MSTELERARVLLATRYGLAFGVSLGPRLRGAVLQVPRAAFTSERLWLEALVEVVTVQESYVLRHPQQLDALRQHLPPRARVWSAACARGEEALSLAIVLEARPEVQIFASDVSAASLEYARAGSYRPRSLRGLDSALLQRHFTPFEGTYLARTELLSRVLYSQLNLAQADAPWPQAIDAVLLRNVLFYFTDAQISVVLSRVSATLEPGGLLVVAPAESAIVAAHGWTPMPGLPPGCFSPLRAMARREPLVARPAMARPPALTGSLVVCAPPPVPPVVYEAPVVCEARDATAALARRLVRKAALLDA